MVNTLMETSAAKFVVRLIYTDEEIDTILTNNSIKHVDDITDTNLINIPTPIIKPTPDPYIAYSTSVPSGGGHATFAPSPTPYYADKIPYIKENGIEIYNIKTSMFSGKMMIVNDPGRVIIGTSFPYGTEYEGLNVIDMAVKYGAVAAVNGGGFSDINGKGNGGIPLGIVFSQGSFLYGDENEEYEVIGFDEGNRLIVGWMTPTEARNRHIRDCLSFGPILIVNGKGAQISGYGSGVNPRTAIGQRSDGAVLLLVIDGRQVNSIGATYSDLITIMLDFGAVNAANLDGGNSTSMLYKGDLINNAIFGRILRRMPTAVMVLAE